jgi:choline dehydrogenase-like flavoprotein
MLSGICPGAQLAKHGIATVHDLPGVGKNLQDHIDFIQLFRSRDKDLIGISPHGLWNIYKAVMQWRRDGTGLGASPLAEAGAFVKSSPDMDKPDLQLHFLPGIGENHMRKISFGFGYSCHVCALRPHSRGEVQLASANPMAAPSIDPNFLSDERDLAALVTGTRLTQRIMAAPAIRKYLHKELHLTGKESDSELEQHIRSRADTIYHPVGTCRMGTDGMAVVDPALRVRGVEGLRVVDASVMPTLIGGNTNAPTVMIAEKTAHAIRRGG